MGRNCLTKPSLLLCLNSDGAIFLIIFDNFDESFDVADDVLAALGHLELKKTDFFLNELR